MRSKPTAEKRRFSVPSALCAPAVCQDIDKTVEFYTCVLGMEKETFGEGRVALKFGSQKLNLHEAGKEFDPKAAVPTPGSADICLITELPIQDALERVKSKGV